MRIWRPTWFPSVPFLCCDHSHCPEVFSFWSSTDMPKWHFTSLLSRWYSVVKNQKHRHRPVRTGTAHSTRGTRCSASNCLDLLLSWKGLDGAPRSRGRWPGVVGEEGYSDNGHLPTGTEVIQYFNNSYGHTDNTVCIALSPKPWVT